MYGIMRVEKRARSAVYGLQIEANRTQADHASGREFHDSDIEWDKTNENIFLAKTENWNKTITKVVHKYNLQERKDSIVLLDGLYTASESFFEGKSKDFIVQYFKDCLEWHKRYYGPVINAVIHLDEKTPHMAVASIPVFKDKDGNVHLSAKRMMGGRTAYRKRQDLFFEEVSKKYGLERGERRDPAERKKHTTKRDWQNQQLAVENEKLQKEKDNLQVLIEAMTKASADVIERAMMSEFLKVGRYRTKDGKEEYFQDAYMRYRSKILPDLQKDLPNNEKVFEELNNRTTEQVQHSLSKDDGIERG